MDEFGGDLGDFVDISDDLNPLSTELSDGVGIDLDAMSLDELYSLRDELTGGEDVPSDYSFHWDGTPTHNVEWDDEPGDTTYTLKR